MVRGVVRVAANAGSSWRISGCTPPSVGSASSAAASRSRHPGSSRVSAFRTIASGELSATPEVDRRREAQVRRQRRDVGFPPAPGTRPCRRLSRCRRPAAPPARHPGSRTDSTAAGEIAQRSSSSGSRRRLVARCPSRGSLTCPRIDPFAGQWAAGSVRKATRRWNVPPAGSRRPGLVVAACVALAVAVNLWVTRGGLVLRQSIACSPATPSSPFFGPRGHLVVLHAHCSTRRCSASSGDAYGAIPASSRPRSSASADRSSMPSPAELGPSPSLAATVVAPLPRLSVRGHRDRPGCVVLLR